MMSKFRAIVVGKNISGDLIDDDDQSDKKKNDHDDLASLDSEALAFGKEFMLEFLPDSGNI